MTTARPGPAIRVVVAEADAGQCSRLVRLLQHEGDIVVVGTPTSAPETISLVGQLRPDVLVLDLLLRDGDSRQAISQIMARAPTSILVVSTRISARNATDTADALVAGALDALPIPTSWTAELEAGLRRAVRQLSRVHVVRHPRGGRPAQPRPPQHSSGPVPPVVAIAASTGGPSALALLLAGLADLPAPVLVVQHLHPDFTDGLVEWMSRVSALPVTTAAHLHVPRPGHVYFAPGGLHLRLGVGGRIELGSEPRTVHRPSGDELFCSVAERAGPAAVGVVLTGMGEDGAKGLLAISRRGGRTFAQNEATSAVFGMPKAAERLGAVDSLLPITRIAAEIKRAVGEVLV